MIIYSPQQREIHHVTRLFSSGGKTPVGITSYITHQKRQLSSWDNKNMALRNPIYLDSESLLAHAEYNEINLPVQAEIVETTVSQRGGKAQVGYGPLSAGGTKSSEVELQSSYVITPSQKATVSKVIDSLIHEKVVSLAHKETAFVKDDLIEI